MKYRKKPVVIEARKLTNESLDEIIEWLGDWYVSHGESEGHLVDLLLITLEGSHIANYGDYIIKGVKGEFYPCKPDIFEMTYEKVEE